VALSLIEAEMNEKRTNLEVIAPSVEEAIARGLADLGLPEEAVDIEVLDTGTRGLFGLGTRQARVRLSIKVEAGGKTSSVAHSIETRSPSVYSVESEATTYPTGTATSPAAQVLDEEVSEEERLSTQEPDLEESRREDLEVARRVVEDLVDKMHVQATVTAEYGEPDEPEQRPPLIVNIEGKDLSILIGPHAETLNALQYISGLIIGKQLGHSLPLVVDVEGYRQRRSREVRLLARRMAEQAVRTGKRQYLEPMPANERRLVHIELRDHPDVKTESVGEEPHRKVTVVLKQ
jgi:spoIIIJ-associated protein